MRALRPFANDGRQGDVSRTSPARAARETAALLGLNAVEDSVVRDVDFGSWAGRRLHEIAAAEPSGIERWLGDPNVAPHGGETIAAVALRAAAWLNARAETGRLVCVTHPAFVRAVVLRVLDAPLTAFYRIDVQPLHATDVTHDGRRWNIRAINVGLREQ